MSGFERIGSEDVYEGDVAKVRIDEFRYEDGSTAKREVVVHPGAVAVVCHDDLHIYLVRQPREPVGEQGLLELPAGKLDVEGESPLECAKRELVEEIGKEADDWEELKRFYTSPGFADEEVYVFLATNLRDVPHEPDPAERIEVVPWPLSDLGGAIDACADAKSLVGLFLFRERRELGPEPEPTQPA
jgi:8-oxo-dGTP pyrophosphatase MutT (NUDIX family)